jgi:ABC-type Fe3+-hydroxamate transport system substrate-binding protein
MARKVTDQMNRTIRLEGIPRRIVSLVPSQTELLYDLGLREEVVGITKFCIYPEEWFKSKNRVGGTKQVNIEKVKALQPDLIIGNKEENTIEDIAALEKIAPVWMSDIYTYEDALEMISLLGNVLGKVDASANVITEIENEFKALPLLNAKKVLYFIWKDPDYLAGKSTFIDAMIFKAGFENLCNDERYPELKGLKENPDFIFLSSEPYPFKKEHELEFQQRFPTSKIVFVDGELFSWYGSRMKRFPNYVCELIKGLPCNQ